MTTSPSRGPLARHAPSQASRRSAVPSFIVMDVMQAAAAREALGAQGHPHGGRPARHACAARRAGGRKPGARARDAGLYRGLGIACAARAHRPALRGALRRRGRAGARGGDDRLVGRLRAGVPGPVRCRRQGCAAVARLSLLPPYPDRARPERRAAGDGCAVALDADGGRHRRRAARRAALRAWSWRAPPIRPARCWSPRAWPRSPPRAGATACGSSPTRSITG